MSNQCPKALVVAKERAQRPIYRFPPALARHKVASNPHRASFSLRRVRRARRAGRPPRSQLTRARCLSRAAEAARDDPGTRFRPTPPALPPPPPLLSPSIAHRPRKDQTRGPRVISRAKLDPRARVTEKTAPVARALAHLPSAPPLRGWRAARGPRPPPLPGRPAARLPLLRARSALASEDVTQDPREGGACAGRAGPRPGPRCPLPLPRSRPRTHPAPPRPPVPCRPPSTPSLPLCSPPSRPNPPRRTVRRRIVECAAPSTGGTAGGGGRDVRRRVDGPRCPEAGAGERQPRG